MKGHDDNWEDKKWVIKAATEYLKDTLQLEGGDRRVLITESAAISDERWKQMANDLMELGVTEM